MRVLLEECVPEGFRALLPDLRVVTAREAGVAGRKNGDLLAAAEGRFVLPRIADLCEDLGLALPIICTPEELLGVGNDH